MTDSDLCDRCLKREETALLDPKKSRKWLGRWNEPPPPMALIEGSEWNLADKEKHRQPNGTYRSTRPPLKPRDPARKTKKKPAKRLSSSSASSSSAASRRSIYVPVSRSETEELRERLAACEAHVAELDAQVELYQEAEHERRLRKAERKAGAK